MFFERRTQSSIKHRRLRYLLLLSLRLALLLLLILAFADPYISRPAASMSGNKLLLLVIDNSFSMRAGSRIADARRQAMAVLSSRPPTERAQVMALGSQLQALTSPTEDPGPLRAAVEGVQAGDSRGSLSELARALRSMAETVHTPIELHFFSDMQKSAMPASFAEMTLPANVSLVLHPVADTAVPNWLVESVDAPGQVWDLKKAHVEAVIAGYHTPAAKRTVSLVINGNTVATQAVEVPAGGRATVEFPIPERALRIKPLRGEDRFRGRARCRRYQPLRRRAIGPGKGVAGSRLLRFPIACLFRDRARRFSRRRVHAANGDRGAGGQP